MTAANATQPQQKSSNVVPMTRTAQQPASATKASPPGSLTPVETHPPDEPGYGHGV
jgi:hypothetical protein